MEKKNSKLVKLIDEIHNSEHIISDEMHKKELAEKEIINMLGDFFPTPLKKLVDSKLFDNFDEKTKNQIFKEREKRHEENKHVADDDYRWKTANNSTSYSVSNLFDPEVDKYLIVDISIENDNVVVTVEYIKGRSYLGITGTWIPILYSTKPFPITELIDAENKENDLLSIKK